MNVEITSTSTTTQMAGLGCPVCGRIGMQFLHVGQDEARYGCTACGREIVFGIRGVGAVYLCPLPAPTPCTPDYRDTWPNSDAAYRETFKHKEGES